ncbi:MAG TPA: glycosyltransferase family 4 protein [Anaerolineae bacterium]|nr:glycosyltransferase family 4 protein [Anaerolineae bacterium]
MRVLMVSKACVVGVYQKKLEELARQPDMELTVIVPPFWRDERGVLPLEQRHTDGYDLIVEPMAFNGHFHLHFYPRLGRQMRRLRPHLVHIDEEPYNLATAHALWLARRFGAKTLFFSWQNIARRYPPPFRWLERYVLRHADHGLVGNREAAAVWRAKGYGGPLTVIPQFGVDPDLFRPAPRPAARPFTIGYVGRLVAEKGVDLLLTALAALEGDWRASILGSGPACEALQAQVQSLGLSGRVSFGGWIDSARMPDHYRSLDVLVLPSRTRPNWKEQFGRVLVEAMACGVPVIGSDSGEIPHVIGKAGLVFPEGQAEALRAHLARLLADGELRAALARRGRERVLAHYTQAQIAAQTYRVYRDLLSITQVRSRSYRHPPSQAVS